MGRRQEREKGTQGERKEEVFKVKLDDPYSAAGYREKPRTEKMAFSNPERGGQHSVPWLTLTTARKASSGQAGVAGGRMAKQDSITLMYALGLEWGRQCVKKVAPHRRERQGCGRQGNVLEGDLLVARARGLADGRHEILLVKVGLDQRLPEPERVGRALGGVKLGKLLGRRCKWQGQGEARSGPEPGEPSNRRAAGGRRPATSVA